MEFALSEEQEMLQETLRGYVEQECPITTLRVWYDEDTDHHPGLWAGMLEMGIAGLMVPEAHGGSGLGLLDAVLVAEVLGAGAVPSPFFGHMVATIALLEAGNEAQCKAWLPRLADGDCIATVAMGEGEQRWSADDYETNCVDGRVTGSKAHVAGCDGADVFVVALADGGFALVEKAAPGVRIEAIDSSDRTRRVSRVTFDAAPGVRLEREAEARVRDAALVLLAADALGGAWRMVEISTAYAKERQQFGQTIAHFQAVKHQLANMALDVEPGRALVWFAGYAWDERLDESEEVAAVAKAHLSDRFTHVAREGLEIFGGYGMTWDCDAHIWLKRSLFDRTMLGGPMAHRARIADLNGWTNATGESAA